MEIIYLGQDLDSHANMVVVGKHAAIINDTGRRADRGLHSGL